MLLSAIVLFTSTLTAPLPPDAGKEARQAFEKKLEGEWGQGGACIGDITLRASGTFERRHYSPRNNTLSGTWKLKWDSPMPTLVLTCDKSDWEGNVGKTHEMKVTQLDEKVMNWESGGQTAGRFKRKKDGVVSP